MAFLTPAELNTHLYGEVVDEITRDQVEIAQSAVDAAIEEAMGYLSGYDRPAILAQTGANRNPVLLLYMKDIAVWHFINLANPAVEMELRLQRYEKAIAWLKSVQAGKAVPILPVPGSPEGDDNFIKFGSNPRRNNYF